MQVTDELIRSVVQEVLSHMRGGHAVSTNGHARNWGVFEDVDSAVAAAVEAQKQFEARGLEDRRKAVDCSTCMAAASTRPRVLLAANTVRGKTRWRRSSTTMAASRCRAFMTA